MGDRRDAIAVRKHRECSQDMRATRVENIQTTRPYCERAIALQIHSGPQMNATLLPRPLCSWLKVRVVIVVRVAMQAARHDLS